MKKAVMTIHGFLTVTQDFGRLYDYLDVYDEVKAVEIPGHNGQKPDFKQFTPESTFRAVLDAYDELKERNDLIDVVGFSMGGAIAAWLCSVRSVNRAALVSPANKFINAALPFATGKYVGDVSRKAFNAAEGKLGDRLKAANEALAPYFENVQVSNKIAKERTFRYMNPRTYAAFSKIVKSSNVVIETTSPNKTPTLILWGKLDELVPQKTVTFLTKHFSNAQVKIYDGIGHAMLYSNRDDEIIRDVVEFLTEGKVLPEVPKR